ncbi:uncharacterized protein LOC111637957 isoform X2 [Centruroides sculpturatus]|uniref:uncharacterized protein LOC111637957 isoform X2 n=1 Tax=Centruroides sculpturatus TaxID=218467 RepID=UPI000C6D52F3|nr:uncharacterized protein LOC111637957 isoform X2 [Centruroides sculpturatus]
MKEASKKQQLKMVASLSSFDLLLSNERFELLTEVLGYTKMNDAKETLYVICLNYVLRNLTDVLTILRQRKLDLNKFFSGFPPAVCEDLLYRPYNKQEMITNLFRYGIKVVDLSYYQHDFSIKYRIKNCEVSQNMQQRCQTIVYMIMTKTNLSENNINTLTCHLKNVSVLVLNGTRTTDRVLETIGSSCHFLENLDVSGCPITNSGLLRLSYDSQHHNTRCKHLKVSKIRRTEVTWSGILYILTHKHVLDADIDTHVNGLHYYSLLFQHSKLNLRKIRIYPIQNYISAVVF